MMRGDNTLYWAGDPMASRPGFSPSGGGHPTVASRWCQSTRRTVGLSAVLLLCSAASARPLAAQTRQDFLTADIDSSVSPREDFFQFANGTWLNRHPLPAGASRWGIWNVV